MTRGATPRTPTGSQLIIKQGRVTSQSVYQTIRHHEYNYSSNAPAPKRQKKQKKTDSIQLKSIKEQRRQHMEEHQVSVIAGLLLALEAKSNYQ